MLFRVILKTFVVVAAFDLAAFLTLEAGESGCFTIIVGKDASADGHVILAHNEDDPPPQVVNHHKIPRLKHTSSETVRLLNGGEVEQVEETWAYIWSEMPGVRFSDSYVNEWGVAITSNRCPSREDFAQLFEGGISYNLRSIVAQRATSSREAVHLAGELVERFGYDASGRTYAICDPEEGWLFCAVNGRHWLARRVPDNQVAMIANTFTVQQVDLSDTINYLSSPDIVEYAVSRGWHDAEGDRPLNFAASYASPRADLDSSNFCRVWSGLRHIVIDPIPLNHELPFSVTPWRLIDVPTVTRILRDHYEGTVLYKSSPQAGSPHQRDLRTVCSWKTQTSFVVQLRRNMPLDIGICYWLCLARPCTSFYIPIYFGATDFPIGFNTSVGQPSEDLYRQKVDAPFELQPSEAFYMFSNFHDKIDRTYKNQSSTIRSELEGYESRTMMLQEVLEAAVTQLHNSDTATALELLSNHSRGLYLDAMTAMDRIVPR